MGVAYHWFIPLVAAIASLGLAILVNRTASQTRLNRIFVFLAALLVLWNLNFFVLYSVEDRDLALKLTKFFRNGGIFLPAALLHLVLALRDSPSPLWNRLLAADYGIAGALAIANLSNLLVANLKPFRWGFYSVGTPLYSLFAAVLLINLIAVVALLVYEYRINIHPLKRLQIRFWLLGAVLAFPLGCTNLLPTYGLPLYPLGSLGTAAWAALVAYAIARHRLMDVDLVVTKGIAYAAVSFILIVPAVVLTLWLQQRSFGQVHPDFSAALVFLFIAISILFPSLRLRAESQIEHSLFGHKHEYRSAIVALTRSVLRILDREKLIRQLSDQLRETLRLEHVAVALLDEGKGAFVLWSGSGPSNLSEIPETHELIDSLARRQAAVLRNELESSTIVAERDVVTALYSVLGWEVCIPLEGGGRVNGFIALGPKGNRDAFFAEDLDLLETLANEVSVALENARLYEELKRSQDIIRRADRLSALGTLAAGIAHEIRNPLVAIQTFFQLAPDRLQDEEFFTSFLSMTANEVKRISDLISELLSFARSPTRTLAPLCVNETAERVVTLLEPEARKHRLRLIRNLSPSVPEVLADGDQIKQVLINLILNAIQATQAGGTVAVSTRCAYSGDTKSAQLEINDTGTGMAKDQLDHIFDPFFTTKDKGTGLGLAIVHQIVREHGGSINVNSSVGQGTTFVITIPSSHKPSATEDANISGPDTSPDRHDNHPRRIATS